MNTPTPTPRTDAATYPADCFGTTLVTNRDCARALETELVTLTGAYTCTHHNDQQRAACPVCLVATLTAERDQLRAELADQTTRFHDEIVSRQGTVRNNHELNLKERDHLLDQLATERARLDSGTILLTVAGERVWHCGVDLRAAIDAAMKEDAKVATGSASDWARGYFCAVAKMIQMEGQVQPDAKELFQSGGDALKADLEDQAVFRAHGLLPNTSFGRSADNEKP